MKLHHTDTGGDGRPVILIHGWPLSGAAWEKQVPALQEAGYRVITYDRRGFGQSEKPEDGFDYKTLATDLNELINELDLRDVTLVGFSMGGGEVVRYLTVYGGARVHSAVLAAAVPPFMMQSEDNPEGPLTPEKAAEMEAGLREDREAFFDGFTKDFFTANGELKVSEEERQKAIELCRQSDQTAALGCMDSFANTDFRKEIKKIEVPILVLHGDADGIVPFEGSGERSYNTLQNAVLKKIAGAPHGFNTSHADEFNEALIAFLQR